MLSLCRIVKYCWAAPLTAVGLTLALLARASGGTWARRGGVIEVSGGLARLILDRHPIGPFAACAIGHVVIARDRAALERARTHELEHVRQFERWGVLFPFLYFGDSAVLWARGRDPYADNRFERAARAAEVRAVQ